MTSFMVAPLVKWSNLPRNDTPDGYVLGIGKPGLTFEWFLGSFTASSSGYYCSHSLRAHPFRFRNWILTENTGDALLFWQNVCQIDPWLSRTVLSQFKIMEEYLFGIWHSIMYIYLFFHSSTRKIYYVHKNNIVNEFKFNQAQKVFTKGCWPKPGPRTINCSCLVGLCLVIPFPR